MVPRRTYIVSVHEQEGDVLLEDVRTRRRVRLADLAEIGEQIARWLEQDARNPAPPSIQERAS
ncbi:MAG TPA: hypothetical protein VNT32_04215 [Thermoleophilaceae bacterium]|nr:hypothetical protein [Thermoleophilaceae bacterium]